jgi:hypothetical protein
MHLCARTGGGCADGSGDGQTGSPGEMSPATGPVVGDDRSEQGEHRILVDVVILADLDCLRRGVVVALVYDTTRVGNGRVVDKHVDVGFRREQGTNVAVQHEVGLDGSFDGLLDVGVRGMDEIANLLAYVLLPLW